MCKAGRKNQTHVDLGTHSVGKEACCVHLPGSSKIECFSSKGSVYRRGYLPRKQLGGWLSFMQAGGLWASGQARTREEATDGDKEAGTSLSSAEGLSVFTGCRKAQRED